MPLLFWYRVFLLLGLLNRNLSEFLEILHEFESGLAGACAGGLITLFYLSVSVLYEHVELCLDFSDKILHFVLNLVNSWIINLYYNNVIYSLNVCNLWKKMKLTNFFPQKG